MLATDTLNLDRLTAPISAEHPTGVDLRSDRSPNSLYRQIRDVRDTAKTAERQLLVDDEEGGGTTPPDWVPVFDLTRQALAEKTKDLELTVYLLEALVRRDGLAGLSAGFHLIRELCERYWDQLYPGAGAGAGLADRVAPLAGLNDVDGLILEPMNTLPITEASAAGGPYDGVRYQKAVDLTTRDEATRQKRIAAGTMPLEALQEAAQGTSPEFYARAVAALAECTDALEQLGAVLQAKCGRDAPSTARIRAALQKYGEALRGVAKDKVAAAMRPPGAPPAPAGADGPAPPAAAAPLRPDGPPPTPGPIGSREEALQTLLKVAEFFRRTEPHTPVSYALEEAVRWGRMKLPDLLEELIADEGTRQQVFKRVGIRPPSAG